MGAMKAQIDIFNQKLGYSFSRRPNGSYGQGDGRVFVFEYFLKLS